MRFGAKKRAEREPRGVGADIELEDDEMLLEEPELPELEEDDPDDRRRDPLRRRF